MAEETSPDWISEFKVDRERKRRARQNKGWLVVIAVALIVLLALLFRRPPTVTVAQVRQAQPGETVTMLSTAGFVAAERRSVVAPKYAGRLDEVLVEEGDHVEQGQILAQMDDSDYLVQVQQARAAVQAAQFTLVKSKVDLQKARQDWQRAQKLWKGNAISYQQLQDAYISKNAAQANKKASQARLKEARKALSAAILRLKSTTIRAPFAGTVAKKLADEGAVLAPAAIEEPDVGGIIELVDLNSVEVEAEVSENEIARIKNGQPALVFLDAYPNRVYRATTGTVRPTIDRSKATAVVKVEFQGDTSGVLPDMGARISFLKNDFSQKDLQEEARLRVPATAVVSREGNQVVLVIAEGKLSEHPVEVKQRVGNEVTLAAGPKPGTSIVATPSPDLQEGSRVRTKGS